MSSDGIFGCREAALANYIRLMRPHHYIKNLLVVLPLVLSGEFFTGQKLLSALFGFIVFCAASSAVYVLNDIRDCEKDRAHPTKCLRPVASGKVTIKAAWLLAAVLAAASILVNAFVWHIASTVCLVLYLAINWAYSAGLKNIPLLDIAILVAGFLLRMMYGAVVTGIEISDWLYLTVIVFACYFSLGKRRNELLRASRSQNTRKVLEFYTPDFLDKSMYVCLTLTLAFYALWCMDSSTASRYGGIKLVFTVPLVLLITMKYSMNVEGDSDGDPVEVLVHDRTLLLLCFIYLAVMIVCLYM